MQIPIEEIKIKEGRRRLDTNHVRELADSIRKLGLLNPVTIDSENTLIAGMHRLEAVRQLGWMLLAVNMVCLSSCTIIRW